jgi:hypothetical protein
MRLIAPLLAFAWILTGCAGLVPGVSRESDVVATFGAPAETRQLADGGRVLEYPRTPSGSENWRVTLNAYGTVRSIEQLVDTAHFARLRVGMSVDEVLRELGRTAEKSGFPNLGEEVLSWGCMNPDQGMFFNAHFDAATGKLKYTSRTPDPLWTKYDQGGSPQR